MKISVVCGFFLPVPPVSGGSTEKSWYNLARQFAAQGHEVAFFSRRWPGFPHEETSEGVRHVRLPGFDHRRRLWLNLLLDFLWSWRVCLALPAAHIVIVNAVALPMWLGRLRPRAGRVVIMTGRMPKGQYRRYRAVARVLAASSYVRDRVVAENPGLNSVTRVRGYPIDWRTLAQAALSAPPNLPAVVTGEIVLGYIGRIHTEKGLLLLADAMKIIGATSGLPPLRVLLCGPADIARGGSGTEFRQQLLQRLAAALPADRIHLLEPQFDEGALAAIYRRCTLFCYPSLAEQGETFGVAVAEAMAAGAVPVVSQLACFTDFVHHRKNGLVFDHAGTNAAERLAAALLELIRDPDLRSRLATAARDDVRRYDYPAYANDLLADFAQLTASAKPPSSAP